MKKSFWVCMILLLAVVNFFLVAVSPVLPALALSGELVEGATWSYALKLNGQLFAIDKYTVIDRNETGEKTVWTIKNEFFRKILAEKEIQIYQSESIMKLKADFTLINYESTIKRNGYDFIYVSLKEDEDGYIYYKNVKGAIEERIISIQEPLYLHDYWLIELLVKKGVLTPEKPCYLFFTAGGIDKIEYMNLPEPDYGEVFCYLAGNDRIYFNKNQDIIRVDNESHGTFEFIPGENLPEEELPGYDTTPAFKISNNIRLIKPENLQTLTLYIDIEQAYENVDYLQTPSGRQRFVGTVNNGRIKGEVTITREPTGPMNPFPFPVNVEWGPEFNKYLESHSWVEADAPEIIAIAREITKTATNTWEAAQSIAGWVWKNTEFDHSYSNLSAIGTLKEGKGVCKQLAFLTIALCRAVKIPARYISGYSYNPLYNTFFLHAWVEVYTDEAGWRSMDPTYGQFDFADLAHIGLNAEVYTSAVFTHSRPGVIKVLDYIPQEAGPIAPAPLDLTKLEIYGKELRYEIFVNNKREGEYTAHLYEVCGGFCLQESVHIPAFDNSKAQSKLLMDGKGYILEYSKSLSSQNYKRKGEFLYGDTLQINIDEVQKQWELPRVFQDEVQLDFLNFVQWGLLAARLAKDVEKETVKTVTVFIIDPAGYRNVEAVIKPCAIEYGGNTVDGWFCSIAGAQYKKELYLTKDAVLTRVDIPELGMRAVLVE